MLAGGEVMVCTCWPHCADSRGASLSGASKNTLAQNYRFSRHYQSLWAESSSVLCRLFQMRPHRSLSNKDRICRERFEGKLQQVRATANQRRWRRHVWLNEAWKFRLKFYGNYLPLPKGKRSMLTLELTLKNTKLFTDTDLNLHVVVVVAESDTKHMF